MNLPALGKTAHQGTGCLDISKSVGQITESGRYIFSNLGSTAATVLRKSFALTYNLTGAVLSSKTGTLLTFAALPTVAAVSYEQFSEAFSKAKQLPFLPNCYTEGTIPITTVINDPHEFECCQRPGGVSCTSSETGANLVDPSQKGEL